MNSIENPFNVGFGEEPRHSIQRNSELEAIVSAFQSYSPTGHTYLISGPRGSGKTVLLNKVSCVFSKLDDWIVVNLNPYRDVLEQMAASLYERGQTKRLFFKTEFNFSFQGLSISIKGEKPVSDIISMLEKMLSYVNQKKKRVLITVDDVSNQKGLREFIHSYQSFIREGFPVFLLMSGLYENINDVENSKSLTFLIRAPRVCLSPLPLRSIANSYENILGTDENESAKLAKLTGGFAYAYQLLGSIMFETSSKKANKKILQSYDELLEANVYQKIFDSLSVKEKDIIFAMCEGKSAKIADIIASSGINNSALQVYKKRLINSGIVVSNGRGFLSFALPRFAEYIRFQKSISD